MPVPVLLVVSDTASGSTLPLSYGSPALTSPNSPFLGSCPAVSFPAGVPPRAAVSAACFSSADASPQMALVTVSCAAVTMLDTVSMIAVVDFIDLNVWLRWAVR